MKRILSFTFLLLISFVFLAQKSMHLEDGKAEIISNLKRIEDSYFEYLSFHERRAALSLLDETIDMIENNNYPNRASARIIKKKELNKLKKEINNAFPPREIVIIISNYIIKGYAFTVDQVIEIASTQTFDKDRVAVIGYLYPGIWDKENSLKLVKALSSTHYIDELLEEVYAEKK